MMKHLLFGIGLTLVFVCNYSNAGNDTVIESIQIEVVDELSWDSALGGFLSGGGVLEIVPDVKFCFESKRAPTACSRICTNSRKCQLNERRVKDNNIKITVVDVDRSNSQHMATFTVPDAARCSNGKWCLFKSNPSNVRVSFKLSYNRNYDGAYRGTLGESSTSAGHPGSTPIAKIAPKTEKPFLQDLWHKAKVASWNTAAPLWYDVKSWWNNNVVQMWDDTAGELWRKVSAWWNSSPQGTVLGRAQAEKQVGKSEADKMYKVAVMGLAIPDRASRQSFEIFAKRHFENVLPVFVMVWNDAETARTYHSVAQDAVLGVAEWAFKVGLSKALKNRHLLKTPTDLAAKIEQRVYRKLATSSGANAAIALLTSDDRVTPESVFNDMAKRELDLMQRGQ